MSLKNRLVSLFLLCVMLSSCSSGSSGSSGIDESTSLQDSGSETAETKPIDALAKADYKGYTFKIFGERQTTLSDYFFVEEQNGDVISDNIYNRNKTVEEKYNINLDFNLVDWMKGPDMIRTYTLAGDNAYDLYTCTQLFIGSLVVEKYFVDWKQVKSISLDSDWYVQKANETFSIGDTTPLLFGDFMESNILRCWNFVFNKRLVEENNLENPYDAVDEGRWTLDYLKTSIKDVSRDLNGDSKWTEEDFYGFCTDNLATLDAFSRSLGLNAVTKDSDNLPVLSYYNDKVPTAFEKIYSLYYDGTSTFVSKESLFHINNIFATGNAVYSSFRIDQFMNDEMRSMTDDYGVLPYPKLDEQTEGYGTYLSGTFSAQMISINQPEADWERTGIITEALNAYSHELVIPAIYEVTLKTKTSRDERSIEMLDLILDSRAYSFDSCDENNFPLSPIKTLRNLIGVKKSTDIASYYASVEKQAKEWIEGMIEAYEN